MKTWQAFGILGGLILAVIGFWGTIAYIVVHFVAKFW